MYAARKLRHERLRLSLFIRQFGLCYWCNSPMSMSLANSNGNSSFYCTLDHLKKRELGGTLHRRNVVGAHGKCNSARHGSPEQFLEQLRKIRRKFWHYVRIFEFGPIISLEASHAIADHVAEEWRDAPSLEPVSPLALALMQEIESGRTDECDHEEPSPEV